MMHAGAADRKFAFEKQLSFKSKKKIYARNFCLEPDTRKAGEILKVKQHLWLVLNVKPKLSRARNCGSYPLSSNS